MWALATREQGNEDAGWRVQDQPPQPLQLTQFPRTVVLQPSTGTRGNTPLLFLQQPPKMEQSSNPHRKPQLSSGSRPWAQHLQGTIPLPRVQGNGGWERGCGPGHRPCPLQTSAMPGRPACCLFQGDFPDSTPPGTPLCVLDLLPWQSQVTLECVYGTRTCQL